MSNLRLKMLLILNLITTGLLIYSWIQNSYQIDFAATKNRHLRNQLIQGIKNTNDIDSVKFKAIQIVEGIGQKEINDNNRAMKESNIQIGIFCLLLMINTLIIIELIKKTPHNTWYS